jgi:UDP-N-acetylglucosamine diphosphorylase/glucosamine-1-phosphate N-acetyltransferase
MNCVLFDDSTRLKLLPLTFTRPVADIRVGILTIREKWEKMLLFKTSSRTETFLSEKFPYVSAEDTLFINGSIAPDSILVSHLKALKPFQALVDNDVLIGVRLSGVAPAELADGIQEKIPYSNPYFKINFLWEIFQKNEEAIRSDFELITAGRTSEVISETNQVLGRENIFLEKGASIECAILNGTSGPIYIGKDAEVMEGSMIRGPFAICEHSILKLGTKVYKGTTVGPFCKVGGELSNAIIMGYSNKGHDGFLGNSVIGEWCNLGAGTNTSNLKNNYSEVQLWNYDQNHYGNTQLTFCGLFMGDHSKCAIQTMFNSGTVVGVYANIFGTGFPSKHVPSFSWGGYSKSLTYEPEKAFETAKKVFGRRDMIFSQTERNILNHIYEITRNESPE